MGVRAERVVLLSDVRGKLVLCQLADAPVCYQCLVADIIWGWLTHGFSKILKGPKFHLTESMKSKLQNN